MSKNIKSLHILSCQLLYLEYLLLCLSLAVATTISILLHAYYDALTVINH